MTKKFRYSIALSAMLAVSAQAEVYNIEGIGVSGAVSTPGDKFDTVQKIAKTKSDPFAPTVSGEATMGSITKKEIEAANPSNIFDIVNLAPSAFASFAGRKTGNYVKIRGGENLGYIIDGVYMNAATAGRVLGNLSPEAISDVRIVRDSSSLNMGPITSFTSPQNAPVAGFIVVTTITPEKTTGAVKLDYSSFNTIDGQGLYGGKTGDIYYMANIDVKSSDGKENYHLAQNTTSFFGKTGYAANGLKADFSIYTDESRQETQRGRSDSTLYDSKWKYDPTRTFAAALNINKEWNDVYSTNFQAFYDLFRSKQVTELFSKPTAKPIIYNNKENTYGFDLKQYFKFAPNNVLKVGTQAIYWHSPTGQLYYEGVNRKEQLYGIYLQDEHYAMDGKLALDIGARLDKKHITKGQEKYDGPSPFPSTTNFPLIEDKWAKDAKSLSMGGAYKLDTINTLSARLTYTTIGADESVRTLRNNALKDEKQAKYEVGISSAISKALNLGASLFYYDYKNSNETIYDASGTTVAYYQYDSKRDGFELTAKGEEGAFFYNASYAYLNMEYDSTYRPLTTAPKHNASLLAGWQKDGFSASTTIKYLSKYNSRTFTVGDVYLPVGDYATLDVNVGYKFKTNGLEHKIGVYCKNLTDEKYLSHYRFDSVGMTMGANYRVKF